MVKVHNLRHASLTLSVLHARASGPARPSDRDSQDDAGHSAAAAIRVMIMARDCQRRVIWHAAAGRG